MKSNETIVGMKSNGDMDAITSSVCMTENENEDEHIITGINDDELNDYYDMTTDDNTICNEQLRRMYDSDDNVIIV